MSMFVPTKTFVSGAYGAGTSSAVLNCLKKNYKAVRSCSLVFMQYLCGRYRRIC